MMAVTLVEAACAPELRVWTSEQEDDSADAVTLNLAEGSMGTEGRVRGFRKTHIRSPNSPFYDYSSHLLRGIQEACTNG